MSSTPYLGQPEDKWLAITERLIEAHPLSTSVLVQATMDAWTDIFRSRIGSLRIGVDILPEPQAIGFFLHHLIPEEIARRHAGWRRGKPPSEKDIHCEATPRFSIEVKTSSNARTVFGNRSYAQPATAGSRSKDGYYLTVNFEKFAPSVDPSVVPRIVRIQFGWLDHTDWIAQRSETGQQARISPSAKKYKLVDLLK